MEDVPAGALDTSDLAPPPLAELFARAAAAVPLLYVAVVLGAAAMIGLRKRRMEAWVVPAVAVTIHLAWGIGFIVGLVRVASCRRRSVRRDGAAW